MNASRRTSPDLPERSGWSWDHEEGDLRHHTLLCQIHLSTHMHSLTAVSDDDIGSVVLIHNLLCLVTRLTRLLISDNFASVSDKPTRRIIWEKCKK
jgi:hypothetical protein